MDYALARVSVCALVPNFSESFARVEQHFPTHFPAQKLFNRTRISVLFSLASIYSDGVCNELKKGFYARTVNTNLRYYCIASAKNDAKLFIPTVLPGARITREKVTPQKKVRDESFSHARIENAILRRVASHNSYRSNLPFHPFRVLITASHRVTHHVT